MSDKYKGGVLLTTLLLVFLFSFIFMLVLEDFQLTQRFTHETKEYYIAKTMISMFLADIRQEAQPLGKVGQQRFSSGTLQYQYDQKTIHFIIQLNQRRYRFQINYQEVEKEKGQTEK